MSYQAFAHEKRPVFYYLEFWFVTSLYIYSTAYTFLSHKFGLYVSVTTAKLTCTCILVETFHHARNYVQIKCRKFSSGQFVYIAGASQIARFTRMSNKRDSNCFFVKCFLLIQFPIRPCDMRIKNAQTLSTPECCARNLSKLEFLK